VNDPTVFRRDCFKPNCATTLFNQRDSAVPRVIVTDKFGSYQVAHCELLASVEHRRSKYLNNRVENSHQPTRQRERAMRRFTSPGHAQRFLSAFSGISPHFRPGRHRSEPS
jgi:putative transposase